MFKGELMNKVILITGSTGGLGSVVVKKFVEENAKVIACYTSEEKYNQLVSQLGSNGDITGFQADLTNENEVKDLFKQVIAKFGRLDALCHIAGGFWMGGEISETSLENWNKMMNLNFRSTFLCTREAFRIMKEQNTGRIITISSKTALELPPGMGAYSISKACVISLTETLAKEGKVYNIIVNTILPSTIDTEANRKSMPKADFNKWVKPEDIANVIFSLVNEEMRAVSGTTVKMYGKL
jgi:NAD(P)-dependent dehydrogenase (short-subunit alcohol dehydrogenase family)